MRELSATALAVVFVTMLSIAAFALDDPQGITPAPDAVADNLVKQLVADQPAQASQYLSSYAREQYAPATLAEWMAAIERRTGTISKVQTAKPSIGEDTAEAMVTLRGRKGTAYARVSLIRENGLWKVERLPEME